MDLIAAPDGQPGNKGTIDSPFTLAYALNNQDCHGGDTVYLRGGTYRHPIREADSFYFCSLRGEDDDHRILVRPWQDERVVIDGGIRSGTHPSPKYVTIADLEVTVTENHGDARLAVDSYRELNRPRGGIEFLSGKGIGLINNVIHHCGRGIHMWSPVDGAYCYGNILYDNGWMEADRGHGHGVYTQNDPLHEMWKRFQENIIFDNWGMNFHAYGSSRSWVDRIALDKNVFYETKPSFDGRCLIGCTNPQSNRHISALQNLLHRVNLQVGYGGVPVDDAAILSNLVVQARIETSELTNSAVGGNFEWREGEPAPREGGVPDYPLIRFRPNAHDDTRATLAIFDFQQRDKIDFNTDLLTNGFLSADDRFALYDPTDLHTPVHEATYATGGVVIPSDGREFTVYVVKKLPKPERKRRTITIVIDGDCDMQVTEG